MYSGLLRYTNFPLLKGGLRKIWCDSCTPPSGVIGQSGCGCASVFLDMQGGGKINMNIKLLDVGPKNDAFENLHGFMVFKHAKCKTQHSLIIRVVAKAKRCEGFIFFLFFLHSTNLQ